MVAAFEAIPEFGFAGWCEQWKQNHRQCRYSMNMLLDFGDVLLALVVDPYWKVDCKLQRMLCTAPEEIRKRLSARSTIVLIKEGKIREEVGVDVDGCVNGATG